jgi:hypothetical protein
MGRKVGVKIQLRLLKNGGKSAIFGSISCGVVALPFPLRYQPGEAPSCTHFCFASGFARKPGILV